MAVPKEKHRGVQGVVAAHCAVVSAVAIWFLVRLVANEAVAVCLAVAGSAIVTTAFWRWYSYMQDSTPGKSPENNLPSR